jgi:hypothetical protein
MSNAITVVQFFVSYLIAAPDENCSQRAGLAAGLELLLCPPGN